MSAVIFVVFTLSVASIIGMVYNLLSLRRVVYPPKKILLERAKVLGGAGIIFFVLGLILQSVK